MDKNIKAELSALKTEVLTYLNSLKTVVENIDSKLGQIESIDFNQSEEHVDPDALAQARAWVNNIDTRIDYANNRTKEFLDTSTEPFVDAVSNRELMAKVNTEEADYIWGEMEFAEFVAMWTSNKKKRIDSLCAALDTFLNDVRSRKSMRYDVDDLSSARRALNEIEELDAARNQIIAAFNDRSILNDLLATDSDYDFVTYYDYTNNLLNIVNSAKRNVTSAANEEVIGRICNLLMCMLEQHELEQFDYVAIDPITFELVQLDADKLHKYRRKMLVLYNGRLRRAFAHYLKSKQEVLAA